MNPDDAMNNEDTTESTRSATADWPPELRQGVTNYYVNELLCRIIKRPYESAPELLQFLQHGGPCVTEGELLRLFGERHVFLRVCRRMNIVRRAAL